MSEQHILKPLNDTRLYRYVELENKLSVLLISDSKADKAAAAMDVHVGFFSDPEGVEGLAHFCGL
jgi:insulysin